MNYYLNVIKREISYFSKSRTAWALMLIIPIFTCFLICQIFKEGSPKNLPIGVMDFDDSEFSRMLTRDIQAMPSCDVRKVVTSLSEGKNLIVRGDIYALIVIPRDFQKNLYLMKNPKLVFYYNNQTILIGGIISKDITTLAKTLMVGIDAQMRMKKGLPKDFSIKSANLVAVDEHIASNPYLNYQYFLSLISFGHILQIMVLFVSVWSFGREFKYGKTKEWLQCANNSIIIAFLGKLTPYFFIFSITFFIIYFMYFGLYNAPFRGDYFFIVLNTLTFIATCLSLGALFVSFNGNFRYSLSSAAFYCAMGFAFAGVTFPVISMPLVARFYSDSLPLTYYIRGMIDQTLKGVPSHYNLGNIYAMFVLMILGFLSLYRLKKLAMDESRWYQI